jgi:hypothetical protein
MASAAAPLPQTSAQESRRHLDRSADRYTVRNQTIVSLMMLTYSIDKHQVVRKGDCR